MMAALLEPTTPEHGESFVEQKEDEKEMDSVKCEGIEIGADGSVKGWLKKQSKFLKSWRERWMVLTGDTLIS